ncbi:MAG TPA: cell envelope integrity protein TolA [Roseateles sp.]
MNAALQRDPLVRLVVAIGRQLAHRPYLSASVALHAVVLGLLYAFGSYELALSQQAADAVEVASSLRATQQASTAKRLQDLQTIKELLEKSAGREEARSEPAPAAEAPPQTPQEALQRARELAREIDALDKDIQAEELARLTGKPKPPVEAASAAAQPAGESQPQAAGDAASEPVAAASAPVTAEAAAGEVAALESKARETLARRLKRLEAKANGVQVEAGGQGGKPDGGTQGPDGVRARIADFIGAASERPQKSTRYDGSNYFDHGVARIPPVDASGLVLGRGRMFGKGGEYANRVYLNSWYVIGPFDGQHGEGMFNNPPHPPETAVLLDAVYYGKDERVLRWHYVTAQSYPLILTNNIEDSVYYGYTEVSVDRDCDLTAWIGADDDVQLYLNDRMVWKGGNVNKGAYFEAVYNQDRGYLRDYNRTEGRRVLHFNKGRNKLFFKLSNGPNGAYVSVVLTR